MQIVNDSIISCAKFKAKIKTKVSVEGQFHNSTFYNNEGGYIFNNS
ncbi:MAG: hypothetical protein HQK49_15130 [Oligoflexia bacterium]|nr:hypothetical protein [Oligoflexia bacterium]